jgi:hypothetical protein
MVREAAVAEGVPLGECPFVAGSPYDLFGAVVGLPVYGHDRTGMTPPPAASAAPTVRHASRCPLCDFVLG